MPWLFNHQPIPKLYRDPRQAYSSRVSLLSPQFLVHCNGKPFIQLLTLKSCIFTAHPWQVAASYQHSHHDSGPTTAKGAASPSHPVGGYGAVVLCVTDRSYFGGFSYVHCQPQTSNGYNQFHHPSPAELKLVFSLQFFSLSPFGLLQSPPLASSVSCFSSLPILVMKFKPLSSSASKALSPHTLLSLARPICYHLFSNMSINLSSHAFAGNPIRSKTPKPSDPFSPNSAFETLKTVFLGRIDEPSSPHFKVLPFRKGRPLARSIGDGAPNWSLGWLSLGECRRFLENSAARLKEDSLVYLGSKSEDDVVYWAVDVSDDSGLVNELGVRQFCFAELRTLMVATDWGDATAMGELAVAGHARALLEWHNISRFCGHCGERTVPKEAGRRKQCSNELCKKRIYPRIDPVVIMLVIDEENDRVLLSRQSRFVPRMWSCLAGFIEPGESLEEAVRRETWEETGIEVGKVVYHSSQPWPVGPNSMPCQLMVGFFAYAQSLEINVDKEELEDAQWQSREDVKKALASAEYKKAQRTAAIRVEQMCKGVEKGQSLSADFSVESGELTTMFFPGPFAIAHHLISAWAYRGEVNGVEAQLQHSGGSLSNL